MFLFLDQLPVLFVLMCGKKKSDYQKILQELLAILPTPVSLWKVTIDFEKALWSALRQVLPTVVIQGCVFHWTQALWRKVSII